MDRRKFIRSGGLALAAVAAMPRAARAFGNKQEDPGTVYRSEADTTSNAGQWIYEIKVNHYGFENFKSASAEEKLVILKVGYFENGDFTSAKKQGEYQYIITAAKSDNATDPVWSVSTKFSKKVSGDHKFDKSFPKNPTFKISKYKYAEIIAKDGTSLQYMPYPTKSETGTGTGNCFLTTACVQHKQLPDDCEPLQVLRSLRDEYMMKDKNGKQLVQFYYQSGPAIVRSINQCSNKAEIYDYMYEHMIQPSVELVKEGRYAEAVAYYKTFVTALKDTYQ